LMRSLYSLAWWMAMPLVMARLWWRGRKEPGYRRHLAERIGYYHAIPFNRPVQRTIWVHAVSVGETRAAEPLIDALLAAYPVHTIILTHMTPTGRATGQALFSKHERRILQCYLPYDTNWMVSRFLKYFAPDICILMETEVWPNVVAQCVRRRIPIVLANARLSERSLRKARRFSGIVEQAAQGLTCVAAQTEADAGRLRQLGVADLHVTGSIKFDVTPPSSLLLKGQELRAQFGNRPVLLCASTREGEETLILNALDQLDLSDALIVIVPRHPQRFDEVERMLNERHITMARRSTLGNEKLADTVRVLLGDSMGEMFAYYEACDLAFIGGSLLPLGGQNLIEACALGKPVLVGPHTFNFSTVTEDATAASAAIRVTDATMMLREASRLLKADGVRTGMGMKAKAFAEQHRGATARTMALLKTLID
jgi:3-deoxy-D-manno-octulosonic-acid transferase